MPILAALIVMAAALLGAIIPTPSPSDDDASVQVRPSTPGPDVMQLLSMNHALGLSDLVWLDAVQAVGSDGTPSEPNVHHAQHRAHLALDLDPENRIVAWATGYLLLTYQDDPDLTDWILDRAIESMPKDWEFPFMKGYNAFFVRQDGAAAARHYEKAAAIEGVPWYVAGLASRAAQFGYGADAARDTLREMLTWLPEGRQRADVLDRLRLLDREELLERWDEACAVYLDRTGTLPPSPQTLTAEGLIDAPTVDSFGAEVFFDQPVTGSRAGACVARTAERPTRDFEVFHRVTTRDSSIDVNTSGPQ